MVYPTHVVSFTTLEQALREEFKKAPVVKTERWQGVAVNTNTRELRNVCYEVELSGITNLDYWRRDCRPNLPWADDHFLERVGGAPLNPGVQWANWPWGHSANKFRDAGQQFNHTYMERLWPKYAARSYEPLVPQGVAGQVNPRKYPPRGADGRPHFGIRNYYGDLWDLVELLAKEPFTRQAWLPLFFPEDTGISDGGRKMCSLGYQLMVREGQLHMYYPLRSCDLIRHWRDDCYLAIRMMLWVLDRCREIATGDQAAVWETTSPGTLAMHMTSLHVFETDVANL